MKSYGIEVVINGDDIQLIQDDGDSMIVLHVDEAELVKKWLGDAVEAIRKPLDLEDARK